MRSVEKITRNIARDYQRYLTDYRNRDGRPLSTRTQVPKLRVVRALFACILDLDLILKNPAASLPLPREEQRLVGNVLSEDEVLALLGALNGNEAPSIHNRAIVELLYGCGLRTSELCHLLVEDPDLKEQAVAIRNGEGGKPRMAPIGHYAAHDLQRYLHHGRKFMLKAKRSDPGFRAVRSCGNWRSQEGAQPPVTRDNEGLDQADRRRRSIAIQPGPDSVDWSSMSSCQTQDRSLAKTFISSSMMAPRSDPPASIASLTHVSTWRRRTSIPTLCRAARTAEI